MLGVKVVVMVVLVVIVVLVMIVVLVVILVLVMLFMKNVQVKLEDWAGFPLTTLSIWNKYKDVSSFVTIIAIMFSTTTINTIKISRTFTIIFTTVFYLINISIPQYLGSSRCWLWFRPPPSFLSSLRSVAR